MRVANWMAYNNFREMDSLVIATPGLPVAAEVCPTLGIDLIVHPSNMQSIFSTIGVQNSSG